GAVPRRTRDTGAKPSAISASADNRAYVAAAELRVRMLAFQRRSEEITARHRLTPQRYLLLLLLRASEAEGNELAIGSLIEPLQMSQSSVTRLVQGATRAGLVERHVDPDDRRRQHLADRRGPPPVRGRLPGARAGPAGTRERLVEKAKVPPSRRPVIGVHSFVAARSAA